jgi:peptide/nickel transport system substrate-binding protein
MSKSKWLVLLSILTIAALVLVGCATPAPETVTVIQTVVVEKEGQTVVETVVVKEEVEKIVTQEVIVEVEVEADTPVRTGGWLDTIVMVAEPSIQSAVTRLIASDIDVYAQSSSNAAAFETIRQNNLGYVSSYGSYNELTFNTYGPVFEESTGGLNPFAVDEIREAMNWLIDRNYIVQEIMGGLAIPKFLPIVAGFPDYAAYVDVARELEAFYAYDPTKAEAQITAEMEKLGAVKDGAGKWTFNGEPVTLVFLIRVEDERRQIADYISNQLENIGFAVDRQYKTSSEASVLWVRGNVADGLWHLYTGGWITTAISRNDADNFEFFLGPRSAYAFTTLWQNYKLSDYENDLYTSLANSDYTSLEQRREMFTEAMRLSMKSANRVWIVDRLSYSPYDPNVEVAADLAGGISGSTLQAYTIRFLDREGGELVYAMADVLTEPWNGIAGSNWIYDTVPHTRYTDAPGVVVNPYTGLALPNRIASGSVLVEEGLPVGRTLDWVTLEFAPSIEVPGDAWSDWDAENQQWITAAERFTSTVTAKLKSTVVYPADFFDTVTWHDGSPFSVADFILAQIVFFDIAKEGSAIFDASRVGNFESFMSGFKGMRFVSTDPLTIELYTDNWGLDAENSVATFWPNYGYGTHPWHTMALGLQAAVSGELAFSANQADALGVEWMSFISGPSLAILKAQLDTAREENFIPYANVLSQYLTADEVAERYSHLNTWYTRQGHFWVNNGVYYLNKVFPVEKTLTLTRYQGYTDASDRWSIFGGAALADVEIDGAGRLTIGQEATFDVYVSLGEDPYLLSDIQEVKYLLFDATGALVATGLADAVEDGLFTVTIDAETSAKLAEGSNKLEIAVISKLVSLPSFAVFEFVTAP